MRVDAFFTAQRYVAARSRGRRLPTQVEVDLDPRVCLAIADWFDAARESSGDPQEKYQYEILKEETIRQFEAILEAGVEVRPWLESGQPYVGSKQLRRDVTEAGRIYVYLTSNGHGQGGSSPDSVKHPMVELTHYDFAGIRFTYNDVFRVVHDFFGHVARGSSFAARGEFIATWDHCQMYPEDCRQVLLTETIGQICWFYYGPHLRDADGRVLAPGSPGYITPGDRPYSSQKITPLPQELVDAFLSLFKQVDG